MAVTTIYDMAGSGTWLCPAGVHSIDLVETWGAGGGGSQNASDGAGGGGEYAAEADVAVTPGKRYAWSVGAGGPGGTGSGGNAGGASSFEADTLTVLGHGGDSGGGDRAGGSDSNNTTNYPGGDGGASDGSAGGGGGSSGGTAAAGANGGEAGGARGGAGGAAPAGGGDGGNGGDFVAGRPNPGSAGIGPGGGGGGGAAGSSGGPGADGQIRLTYTLAIQPVVPFFPAGYSPLNTDFDAWIQAPFSFLTSKIVFRAEQSNALALAAGQTLIPFNNVLEDPFGGWNSSSSEWVVPAGYTGIYSVTLTTSCQSNSNNPVLQARIGVSSQKFLYLVDRAWVPSGGPAGLASGSQPVQLYGGLDSIQGFAYLDGGFTGNVAANSYQRCRITVMWASS